MCRLVSVTAGGDCGRWLSLGLEPIDRGVRLGDVALLVEDGPDGLRSWRFTAADGVPPEIDGIPTDWTPSSTVTSTIDGDRSGNELHPALSSIAGGAVVAVDHVVVATDDLERTTAEIASALGAPLRRIREAGNGVRQGFHRLQNTVLEVVAASTFTGGTRLWGLAITVDDLDSVVSSLQRSLGQSAISTPKSAVQTDRRISAQAPVTAR